MISFKILDPSVRKELVASLPDGLTEAEREYADDTMRLYIEHAEENEEMEYAVCLSHGCLLIRNYDADECEYSFEYPMALSSSAAPIAAALEIRAYAVKEEIPLVFHSVRGRDLGALAVNFRHMNIDAADRDRRFFTVRVMSEAALLDGFPGYTGFFGVSLDEITEADDADYFRLCTDPDTGSMWGYDYSADEPDPAPSYFRESAEGEMYRGTAICLAIRYMGKFVGEAVMYYFDLQGGCDVAVRILPEHRRKGYANEAIKCLKTLAGRMGITTLRASVDVNNAPSIALFEKHLREDSRDDKTVKFSLHIHRFCG